MVPQGGLMHHVSPSPQLLYLVHEVRALGSGAGRWGLPTGREEA
jgi:hypothetical protein